MKIKINESGFVTELPPYHAFYMVLQGLASFVAENPDEQTIIDKIRNILPKPKNYWYSNVPENLEQIVMDEFKTKQFVTADDVHTKIMSQAKGRDPKIVGSVFISLMKKGLVRKIDTVATKRGVAHGREIKVWERVA